MRVHLLAGVLPADIVGGTSTWEGAGALAMADAVVSAMGMHCTRCSVQGGCAVFDEEGPGGAGLAVAFPVGGAAAASVYAEGTGLLVEERSIDQGDCVVIRPEGVACDPLRLDARSIVILECSRHE